MPKVTISGDTVTVEGAELAGSCRSPANKGARYPKEALSPAEAERLIEACHCAHSRKQARRDAAIVTLLWRTGMRCNEALSLRRCDLDLDAGTARILRPKGFGRGKPPRVVGLDRRALDALDSWSLERDRMLLEDDAPLFVTQAGSRLSTSHLRRLLPRLAEKAGIAKRVHPHILRHTFAFECAMEGRPIAWISAALGHSSLLVTQQYMNHLAPADVIVGMQERT